MRDLNYQLKQLGRNNRDGSFAVDFIASPWRGRDRGWQCVAGSTKIPAEGSSPFAAARQCLCTFSSSQTLISDWYGTSLAFAATLIASSRCSGNRREIVFVDGLSLGNAAGRALLQSRYSAESFFSQNALSAASLENLGMVFRRLLINCSLFPRHIPSRNHADRCTVAPQGKGHVQAPAGYGNTKGVVSRLLLAVPVIVEQ